jgi:hypothetical protein
MPSQIAHGASNETPGYGRALHEGRQAARAVDEFLMGFSDLPR